MSQEAKLKALKLTLDKIDKTYGKGAVMKLGDTAIEKIDVIPTGSITLDTALGINGLPKGRVVEIYGPESSGKTTLAIHAIAEVQKQGGIAAFIDAEHAFDRFYAENLGVDTENLLISQPDNGEQALEITENLIRSGAIDLIVVDSVAGATTAVEVEADYSKDGWATSKAIILSKAMRKVTQMVGRQRIALIFTNQLRQKLGVMFGDPWTTSGGKAIGFHASCRLRLKSMGQIKAKVNGVDETIGIKAQAQVVKNRMGPPLRKAEFEIYFDSKTG